MIATEILGILIAALLSQNFILVKFYGICPFMGVSKKIDTALGMGVAVTFVMALASAACWAVDVFLLQAFNLGYMQTVSFILVIATLVQVVEMFLKKFVPAVIRARGKPLKHSGGSALSTRSRTEANRTMARVKPRPPAAPLTTLSRKPSAAAAW